jgi:hypothetical protein
MKLVGGTPTSRIIDLSVGVAPTEITAQKFVATIVKFRMNFNFYRAL